MSGQVRDFDPPPIQKIRDNAKIETKKNTPIPIALLLDAAYWGGLYRQEIIIKT